MSFTAPPAPRPRLNRSQLAVPAANPRFIEKATTSAADVVLLDIEDSVPPEEKEQARANVIAALNDLDWGGRTVSLRINGLDTPFMYRDVIDVVEAVGNRLDLIMIPKVGVAADVYAVDVLISQIEEARGWPRRIGLEVLIESALGLSNVEAISAASSRLESLHFGSGDFAASMGARVTTIGGANPDYHVLTDPDGAGVRHAHWNDVWHGALSRIAVAARAHGLRPIDGPFSDFADQDGFQSAARRAIALGFEGKWAIHPSQVDLANSLFTPSEVEVARAQRILDALADARARGSAAVALDGRMIDIASIRQAEVLLARFDAALGREPLP